MAGIYIHIPFCKQACYYCDFHFSCSMKHKKEMILMLERELVLRKNEIIGPIETIYFGGGTPSILSVDEINQLLEVIYLNYDVVGAPEITLEANPDDLDLDKIQSLSQTKINRLSIGIQSFFDDDLKSMNRAHNAKEAKLCLNYVKGYFENITIDLIYGIPGMSNKKWKKNLSLAFDFEIPHISSYALTVEAKTALASFIQKGKYPPVDENLAKKHFEILVNKTAKHNLIQYEISNFGKPKFFSKHNTSYWQGKHYLGIGPSAHSFDGKSRSWNIANNVKYIKSLSQDVLPQEREVLQSNDLYNEIIMTGMRTIWGISLNQIEKEFGSEIMQELKSDAQKHIVNNTLELKNNVLYSTDKGKFLADGIASDLFRV